MTIHKNRPPSGGNKSPATIRRSFGMPEQASQTPQPPVRARWLSGQIKILHTLPKGELPDGSGEKPFGQWLKQFGERGQSSAGNET